MVNFLRLCLIFGQNRHRREGLEFLLGKLRQLSYPFLIIIGHRQSWDIAVAGKGMNLLPIWKERLSKVSNFGG